MKYIVYEFFVVIFFLSCNFNWEKDNNESANNAQQKVARISYSILNTYPHDTSSFTQGLAMYKSQMYEGTGGSDYSPAGKNSNLYQVDLQTGKALRTVKLSGQYFGEGITILNDTIYQLTWREKVVFAYTVHDMKKVKEFPLNTEGWGITNNGKELIVSDGTSNLYFYDPATFRLLHTQGVTYGGEYLSSINELEYIEGFVFANKWQHSGIYKINPNTGETVGVIDIAQIWNHIKSIDTEADVPNGIAYDADTKKIYITGKQWPELYEIQLGQ
jgi:glutamine cyclotransferase